MTGIKRGPVVRTAGAYDRMETGTVTTGFLATALAAVPTPIIEVVVQNDSDSANVVYVGNAFGQYVKLSAGTSITLPVNDLSTVYVVSPAGAATVNWLAMA